MLKKGDRVEYEGMTTTCLTDEFKLLGSGPLVVALEDFDGLINAKLPKALDVSETKWKEVSFETMLQCDGEIKCECWLLSNSINKYGLDLEEPMMLNDFLKQIGTHLTSMNCASLFKQAKWYVIDDAIQTTVTPE